MTKVAKVKIQLVKSTCKCKPSHKETVRGLGLRKINQIVERELTPCIQGMINKVSYLLKVETA